MPNKLDSTNAKIAKNNVETHSKKEVIIFFVDKF